ncbi:hypothetical protein DSM104299_03830 [Baekduia alba]|uniref:hypothetical protein n=1 Tax=Baekduia alba TaxID=2997333 RepID=UPI0023426ABB|nr:hypothetical protein [Baekduia alba]WCB95088.1 hypothetical protein DSM104299_03830 [Baekduia alba]
MRMSGWRAVLLVLLIAAIVGGGVEAAAADTTTVVQAPDRSAPITVLLVGLGAVVGVIVGLVPALLVGMLLGYVPPPQLGRRRAAGVLVEPARLSRPERAVERAPVPAPVALAVAEERPAAPPPKPLGILAHARHQSVYDAAYAAQLERVETLRAAIGGQLRDRPEPPGE